MLPLLLPLPFHDSLFHIARSIKSNSIAIWILINHSIIMLQHTVCGLLIIQNVCESLVHHSPPNHFKWCSIDFAKFCYVVLCCRKSNWIYVAAYEFIKFTVIITACNFWPTTICEIHAKIMIELKYIACNGWINKLQ